MAMDVMLRPIRESDLPRWVEWLNDPEVTTYTHLDGGVTLEHEQQWFATATAPDYPDRLWQMEVEGRHIGGASLRLEPARQSAEFGIIIGDKTAWGQGYGTATLREALRIGFAELALHRIHLRVFAGNARGLRCYEKCGLRREGYHRAAVLKREQWVDVITMAILREEWEEMKCSSQ